MRERIRRFHSISLRNKFFINPGWKFRLSLRSSREEGFGPRSNRRPFRILIFFGNHIFKNWSLFQLYNWLPIRIKNILFLISLDNTGVSFWLKLAFGQLVQRFFYQTLSWAVALLSLFMLFETELGGWEITIIVIIGEFWVFINCIYL